MSVATLSIEPLPTVQPLSPLDPRQQQLAAMFPDLEPDILSQFLSLHNQDVERTVMALLGEDTDSAQAAAEDVDMAMARRMEQEMNEEAAKDVMEEFAREEQERRQQEPLARAAKAMDKVTLSVTDSTKRLLARMKPAKMGTYSTRLLDGEGSTTRVDPLAPITLPPSPLDAAYEPPTTVPVPTPSSPPSAAPSAGDPALRYAARLDRARAANRTGAQMSNSPPQELAPPPTPPVAPAGPQVGQLIDVSI